MPHRGRKNTDEIIGKGLEPEFPVTIRGRGHAPMVLSKDDWKMCNEKDSYFFSLYEINMDGKRC